MLWPIFRPPGTHIAAVIFAVPFLVAFAWDWLVVSGTVAWDAIKPWRWVKDFPYAGCPGATVGVVVLMAWQYVMFEPSLFGLNSASVSGGASVPTYWASIYCVRFRDPTFLLFGAAREVMAIGGLVMLGSTRCSHL
jgi:hypothetical protein